MSDFPVTDVPMMTVPLEVSVRESFDTLYHREFAGLVRLAMVLVDSQDLAEEVVQDAFAALYLRYQSVASPLPYVRASVLNGSRKVLRRRTVRLRTSVQPQADGEMIYNHMIDAVRRLPARQRSVIVLRYDLQLTDSEIAETLNVPVGHREVHVASRHRALAPGGIR